MLLKQTVLYLPSQILAPFAQFAAVALWTHVADARTIGTVTLLVAVQDLFNSVALGWWMQFAMRHYGEYGQRGLLREFGDTTVWVLSGITALQVPLVIANLLLFVQPDADFWLCAVVAAYAAIRVVNQYSSALAQTRIEILDVSIYSISGPVVGLVVGVALLMIYGADPIWPMIGYLAGETCARAVVTAIRRPPAVRFGVVDMEIVRAAWRYGLPLILSAGFVWCSLNLPRYFVNGMYGIGALGHFSIGFGLGQRAASVTGMVVTAAGLPLLYSRFHSGGRSAAMQQLSRNGALVMAALVPSLTGLYLVSGQLVHIIIAPEYWYDATIIIPWAAMAGGASSYMSNYAKHVFLLDRETNLGLVLEAINAVLAAGAAGYCTWRWGLIGAAISIAVSQMVVATSLTVWLIVRRGLIFPLLDLGRIVIATLAMVVIVVILPDAPTWLYLGIRILAGAIMFGVAMSVFYRKEMLVRFMPTGFGQNG